MSDEKTSPPPRKAQADPDDERTVFSGSASHMPRDESHAPMDPDRTIIAGGTFSPIGPAVDDNERTVFAGTNAPTPITPTSATPPASAPPSPTATPTPPRAQTPAEQYRNQSGDPTQVTRQAPLIQRAPTALHGTDIPMATEVPPPTPLRNLEPGVIINNMYRVGPSLDQGGMGRVFRGEELGTGEPVAIKVILPEMADEQKAADMFRREAKTLRQLQHEAIVRYLAYIPPDQRLDFHALVMGFIEGDKLNDRIKATGPLDLPQLCTLFIRLADGLSAAHRVGVVHRDLSPDNVMLPDGDVGTAVLIDFGISRSSTIQDVTLGNEFAGKLKYVSPEQLGAYGGQADARSDVYSMGLLIVMAATGQPLPMGNSIVEAVKMRDTVPELGSVPPQLQGLLYKMLQPNPANRLSSMDLVRAELEAIAGGRETTSTLTGISLTGAPPTEPVVAQAPTFNNVSGLQAAPNVAIAGSQTHTGFGTTGFRGGTTQNPAEVTPDPDEDKGSSGTKLLLSAVVVAVLGIGGVLGYAQFSKPGNPSQNTTQTQQGTDDTSQTADSAIQRVPGSRETFLAQNVPQDCVYATRRAHGPIAGMIEAARRETASLGSLVSDFEAAFASAPSLVERIVTDTQCAALDFARAFQGMAASSTELSLANAEVSRQEIINGTLHGSVSRADWLAIVAPNGLVFSLTDQLNDPIGDQRGFAFKMNNAMPGTYVLLAVSSERPLIRTGAMQKRTEAAAFFPLVERELSKDKRGSVDLVVLNVTR